MDDVSTKTLLVLLAIVLAVYAVGIALWCWHEERSARRIDLLMARHLPKVRDWFY
jgi:hypothetical protein